jgi:acetyl/propionyl-CoA carboxylase alpha subunit
VTVAPQPSLRKDRSGRPFSRVLIANRGEIAVRIIRACRELGVESVALYTDVDADALHRRIADQAVRLADAPDRSGYLDASAIVAAATNAGADAVHPGYGFLAERASFARAVEDAGLTFVGPSSTAIAALGDKLAARKTAAAAGVPVVPGTFEAAALREHGAVATLIEEARDIGFPLLVKAAAGGGGRGMRRVRGPDDLEDALHAASREAASSFGDGSVYLEREVRPARHLEVQLLGDAAGSVVAVGERDCSLQRRHQKLVEEAPAPGLSAAERATLHEMAVAAATAAGLENAATAEFLFDEDRRFWFLEVNTRLQVEHGVTELVADLDIVREQLWLAAGAPLSERVQVAAARAAMPDRHAIEVRLSAEDPARDFAPAPGTIGQWAMPAGPGVRVDTAAESGTRIPLDFDPLIAKVMVVDETREAAIDRLARALDEVRIDGIQTTLPFHRFVASDPGFRAGPRPIDWVDTTWAAIAETRRAAALETAVVLAAKAVDEVDRAGVQGGVGAGFIRGNDMPIDGSGGSAWTVAGRRAAIDRWQG